MAITNYTELRAAIAAWSKRPDLSEQIPTFISLAEARINRVFVARSMERESELMTVAGSQYVSLPAGLVNPVGLWLKAWLPRVRITQKLASELPSKTNTTGFPEYWAIDGDRIRFDKLCQEAWPFDFRWTESLALSADAPTNYVLTHNPDLYLWGALAEVAQYTRDAQELAICEQRFQVALKDAANNENDMRATAPLATELGGALRQGRFNINRGY